MFGFEPWEIACLVGAVLGAVLLVRFAFSKDDEIEDRRRHALNAASELHKIHDEELARVCEDYAIGDYTGIGKSVRDIIRQLMKPNGALEMRGKLVLAALPELLKMPAYSTQLQQIFLNSGLKTTITTDGAVTVSPPSALTK